MGAGGITIDLPAASSPLWVQSYTDNTAVVAHCKRVGHQEKEGSAATQKKK